MGKNVFFNIKPGAIPHPYLIFILSPAIELREIYVYD